MTTLTPSAILRVYDDDRDALGHVFYPGESISYDLPGLLGSPGASYQGFQADPTGTYLMQQMQPVFYNADPPAWSLPGGAALPGTYSYGTDPQYQCRFLYYQNISTAFNVQLQAARALDEGFYANLYLGAATAAAAAGATPVIPAVNFYVEFSRGRAAGEPGLRLALEPTRTIRLQVSTDNDATWTDVASADALGECENYLTQQGRQFNFSVLPMTDAAWEAALPVSLAGSSAPPNQIVVSINGGDAVLTYTADGLAEGSMAVTGQNRQWSCRPAKMRFSINGQVTLAPQIRPAHFQSDPAVFLNGYQSDWAAQVPAQGQQSSSPPALSGVVVVDTPNSAHVEMTLAAAPDSTGYALRSCFLASVDAEFPPVQQRPGVNPSYVDYPLVYSRVDHSYDQTCGTVRHRAVVWLSNQNNTFAPGIGAALGVRAATLFHSIDGVTMVPELTGWTGMEDGGQEWVQDGILRFFKLSLSDKFVHTEPDTAICCGFQLPYDYQPMYYAYGQQAYRLGIVDDLWEFPVVRRNDAVPGYYLDGGTTREPVHQFPPDMTLGQSMEQIRAAGAEYDPITNAPNPMVHGTDALGNLLFLGLPTGVVSLLSDPSLTLASTPEIIPAITFSAVPAFNPDGSAQLNEFVQTWSSRSSLRRVRTPVVVVGVDPNTGSAVFGVAYNEKLGGGRYAESYAPGYIGVDKPLYIVSRLYSSQAVCDLAARNASVQLAVPAIDSGGTLHLQPGLMPLTVVAINDYASQGSTSDVGYYVTHVTGIIDQRDPEHFHEETLLSGRILGLSA